MLNRFFLLSVLFLFFSACNALRSRRSDETSWNEYRQEQLLSRAQNGKVVRVEPPELQASLDEIPLRTLLLSCVSDLNLKSCYQAKLSLAFDEAFRGAQKKTPTLLDSSYKQEQKRFMQSVAFELVLDSVQSFHQLLFSGIEVRAAERAIDFNEECEKNIGTDAIVRNFREFSGGATEVPKGQFSCLSEAWAPQADRLLDETLDRLGLLLASRDSREWIKKHQIYPIYTQETQMFLTKKFDLEKMAWEKRKDEFQRKVEGAEDIDKMVKDWTPSLRTEFPHLPVEAYLTELYLKKKGMARSVAGGATVNGASSKLKRSP